MSILVLVEESSKIGKFADSRDEDSLVDSSDFCLDQVNEGESIEDGMELAEKAVKQTSKVFRYTTKTDQYVLYWIAKDEDELMTRLAKLRPEHDV